MLTNRSRILELIVAGSLFAGGVALATEHAHPAGKADKADKADKMKADKAGEGTAAKTSADKAPAAGEVVLKGEMTCAKCGLHESDKCQNVLRVKSAGGKDTKYYLAKAGVSEGDHQKVCHGPAPATVTGKVSEEGDKKVLAASAIKYE